MGYAFISYSHSDGAFASRLADQLQNAGVAVWFDHDLRFGEQYVQAIAQKIDNAAAFIAVMSQSADDSQFVQNEVLQAQKRGIPIMPIALDGHLSFILQGRQSVFVRPDELPPPDYIAAVAAHVSNGGTPNNLQPPHPAQASLQTTLTGHMGAVRGVAFGPDGQTVASGSDDSTVRLWNVASTDQPRTTIGGGLRPTWPVAFTPDGAYVASGAGEQSGVMVWDMTGAWVRRIGAQAHLASFSFAPNGSFIATAGREDRVPKVWDARTGAPVATLSAPGRTMPGWPITFARDSRHLAVTNFGGNTVDIWDVTTQKPTQRLQGHNDRIRTLTFTPDASMLITGSDDATVRLWDLQSAKMVGELIQHTEAVHTLACSPDGRVLATGSPDDTIRLWDLASRTHLQTLTGHTGDVCAIAFSPDGRLLASGGADRTIKLWRVR